MRRAKIVCTLGPASEAEETLGALIDAGLDCARLNMSHGAHDDHARRAVALRAAAARWGRPVALLVDLQGPKTRIGVFDSGAVELRPGAPFTITTRPVSGDQERVSTALAELPRDVHPGDTILLDDGLLRLEVDAVEGEDVRTHVVVGGTLRDHKGMHLPGVKVSTPTLTAKDRSDIAFGLDLGADYFALSFVRSPDDVAEAQELARRRGEAIPLIAKIETAEAVEHLDAIIDVADGIMVARGDLGVELGPEKVPLVQKQAIEAANRRGKLVITATEMLESMVRSARPTRAEASDVANAVLDGTDALMLSAETAVGAHPVKAVQTMSAIVREIETSARYRAHGAPPSLSLHVSTDAVARAATVAAQEIGAVAIAAFTMSGTTARLLSEYRPEAQIVALTSRETTLRRLALEWGVLPCLVGLRESVDEMIDEAVAKIESLERCRSGAWVVITMSWPPGYRAPTNVLKLHQVP